MHLFSHLSHRAIEARTSRPTEQAPHEAFLDSDIRAAEVMNELAPSGLFADLVTDDARVALLRRYRGEPKH